MKEIKETKSKFSKKKYVYRSYYIRFRTSNLAKKLATSKDEKFFGVKYQDKIIGGLGLKDIKKSNAYWSFYISENDKILGMGAILEFKALDFFLINLDLKNKLLCIEKNNEVIKLHKKFALVKYLIKIY